MAFDDKDLGCVFPTRTVVTGTGAERITLDAMGANTIKTRIVILPDGTEVVCKTRNGHPEFTAKEKKVPAKATSRTFVFRQIGAALGVIYNRLTGVLVRNFTMYNSNYFVSSAHDSPEGNWNNTLRIEGGQNSKLNGATKTSLPVVSYAFGPTAVPVLVADEAHCPDDATRSALFIGAFDATLKGVVSIDTAGAAKSTLSVTNSGVSNSVASAGVRAAPVGDFYFYFGKATYGTGQVSHYSPATVSVCWSKVVLSDTSPYYTETPGGIAYIPQRSTYEPYLWYGGGSHDATWSGGNSWSDVGGVKIQDAGWDWDADDAAYAYSGSEIQMSVLANTTGTYYWTEVTYSNYPNDYFINYFEGHATSRISVSCAAVPDPLIDWSNTFDAGEDYYWTLVGGIIRNVRPWSTSSFEITTMDYVFVDIDEEISLALKTHFIATTLGARAAWVPALAGSTAEITVQYILTVRGSTYEFDVAFNDELVAPYQYDAGDFLGPGGSPKYGHAFVDPPYPNPIFSPTFMSQGGCQFIAYTTKAEELRGATPEIYIDFALMPKLISQPDTTVHSIYPTVEFSPHQLLWLFSQYIGCESTAGTGFNQNTTLWDTLFPPTLPFKVQFANGVKGVWQSQLGEGFTGYPSMEITRI